MWLTMAKPSNKLSVSYTAQKEINERLRPDHHNAESDALACAKLMIELFKKHNTQSFKELEKQLKFNKGKIQMAIHPWEIKQNN